MEKDELDDDELLKAFSEISLSNSNNKYVELYESIGEKFLGNTRGAVFIKDVKEFVNQIQKKRNKRKIQNQSN